MGRPSRETVMQALLSALVASVQTSFTATTSAGSAVLTSPSTTAGLFIGLPVVGGSIPSWTVIQSLSPLTLSNTAGANGTNVACSTGFLTTGRRVIPWGDVAEQPALFLAGDDDQYEWQGARNQKLVMTAQIVVYSNAGQNPNIAPITALNNLLDAIDSVFQPDNLQTGLFTLGGVVQWCRISGKTLKDPGDLDGQALAVLPVEIIVP